MQSIIAGYMGVGKNGEIIIGTSNGDFITSNISEGLTEDIVKDIEKGLFDKKECRIAYNVKPDENNVKAKDTYEILRIWVGEKQIFVSEKAEINPGIHETHEEER